MNDPAEPISSLLSLMQSQNEVLARVYTSEQLQLLRGGFFRLGTMVHPPELRTAPTRQVRSVSVRCMLRPTSSLTLPDMAHLLEDARYTPLIRHAIHAHVYSLMQEYHPWFSIVSIEIRAD